jgi:hypothetical protein
MDSTQFLLDVLVSTFAMHPLGRVPLSSSVQTSCFGHSASATRHMHLVCGMLVNLRSRQLLEVATRKIASGDGAMIGMRYLQASFCKSARFIVPHV